MANGMQRQSSVVLAVLIILIYLEHFSHLFFGLVLSKGCKKTV